MGLRLSLQQACGNYTALDLHYGTASSFEPITNESNHYSTELFGGQVEKIIAVSCQLALAIVRVLFLLLRTLLMLL
jgi:hypothetical protein